jgi:hypothetical protein
MESLFLKRLFMFGFAVGFYVGCSPVKFAKDPDFQKCQNSALSCVSLDGRDYFDYNYTVRGGVVDILIVSDNSASMSEEQRSMGSRFDSFVDRLDSKRVDYRIALTTTDISSVDNKARAINLNGALQDGRLVKFSDGSSYLTPSTNSKGSLFREAIQRPETLQCETWLQSSETIALKSTDRAQFNKQYGENCPSGDERGIYAASLVVKNNPDSFLRADANLAVIVVSDENNRSFGHILGAEASVYDAYALTTEDMPARFMEHFSQVYGDSKQVSVHSIVVKSGDSSCLAAQRSQLGLGTNGNFGSSYEELTRATGGVIGNICASDYTNQLGEIATKIIEKVSSATIACNEPADLVVNIDPVASGLSYENIGTEIRFNQELPAGSKLSLKYSCKTLE